MLRKMIPLLLVAIMMVALVAPGVSTAQDSGQTGATVAPNGMVASSNRYATLAGVEALRQGGNAVDAMAVVQFVLNVTEPYSNGIGGGAFIMIYDAETGEVIAIDGREEAPAGYTPDVFLNDEGGALPFFEAATGGNSVGVPGTLAATARALEEYGTFTLAEALAPAISLARNGYTIDKYFADTIAANLDRINLFPATAALYLDADGNALPEGSVIINEELANTFEIIANEGIGAFYGGEIGAAIVDAVQNAPVNPGVMELSDLEGYRAVRREPVTTNYRGYDIYGMNMPTSGGTTLMLMLNLLEGYDIGAMPWGGLDYITTLANVQSVAFADRNAYMADADFVDVNVAGLLDAAYARERRGLITAGSAALGIAPGTPPIIEETETTTYAIQPTDTESVSTTHFSIVDAEGNMVSVTTTIELLFGSAVSVPGYGFLLNNELTDFSFAYQDADGNPIANAPTGDRAVRRTALGEDANTEGGKRPRSSMAPTIVLRDGQPFMALGSPGGSRIIGYVLNVLVNVIDYDMELQAAVNAPRVIAQNGPLFVDAAFFSNESVGGLQARGFDVRQPNSGSVQAVLIGPDGMRYGAADPRRLGLALGH